jgi:hypothetical protein
MVEPKGDRREFNGGELNDTGCWIRVSEMKLL